MRFPLKLVDDGRPIDVLAVGENSIDVLAVLNQSPAWGSKQRIRQFLRLPGGEAATAAVGVARLGWRAKYIGRFGDDAFGELGRRSLVDEGVDVTDSIVVGGATSRVAIVLVDHRSGERTVLWDRDAALSLCPEDISDADLAKARVLLVGSDDVPAMASAARRARAVGTRTVGDLEHIRADTNRLLHELDVIVMARSFLTTFTGTDDAAAALEQMERDFTTASMVCVTLGEHGCRARVGGRAWQVPAATVDVVDTTGAGDLFRAGLIASWLTTPDGPDVEGMLRYANAVGALSCRAVGARTGAPRRSDVEAFNL